VGSEKPKRGLKMNSKIIASFLAALMLFAPAAMALTALNTYPSFLATNNALDAYVVVGAQAATADVVGAVDLAVRLTELSYVAKTVSGTSSGNVNGIEKDGIGYGTSAGGNDLSSGSSAGASAYTNAFPTADIIRNAQYSGLNQGTYSWKSNNYDYAEQVDLSGVRVRNDFGTSGVNGSLTLQVASGNVMYEYVFKKAINLSTATTAGTTGSISSPEYTYPINIMMMGQPFSIVGVGTNQVTMLQGSIGTATATSGVKFGDYTIYSDLGSNAAWARIIIKDAAGNTVDTLIVNQGDSKDSSASGLEIQVTAVRALQDGTVVGTDVVVGNSATGVEKTYDTSADVTSTGTSSDVFPGDTTSTWGIQVSGSGFTSPGSIAAGAYIAVVYKPSTTQYVKTGQQISLPNNYGNLGLEGFDTTNLATITIAPISGVSAYNYSADTQSFGGLNGLEISSSPSGSIISRAGNSYSQMYILLNTTLGSDTSNGGNPVMIGYYDTSKSKIIVNGTLTTAGNAGNGAGMELESVVLNGTAAQTMSYAFRLNYASSGQQDWYLNVTIGAYGNIIQSMKVGVIGGSQTVSLGFQNESSTKWSITSVPQFQLGSTSASAETNEVNVTTEGTVYGVGTATQNIVDDKGVIVVSPASNGASDQVVVQIPDRTLAAKVYFGILGAGASSTGGSTYHQIVPITTPVAKLDTDPEMQTGGSGLQKNIVTVGGPCVNKITAEAMNLTYPTCGAASTIPANAAIIQILDDVFTTGKKVVVVAGYNADNTRTACTVLQQYDTLLTGITASKVTVTAATTAGITASA